MSRSPSPARGRSTSPKAEARVVVVSNLTRNIAQPHLQVVFGVYGQISKIDLPMYQKSGQNKGKAALEFSDPAGAQKAVSHMDGGQLDGAVVHVVLSSESIRSPSPRSRSPRPPPRRFSRSRSPPRYGRGGPRGGGRGRGAPRGRDIYRGRRSSRSRSPIRRGGRLPPRRRSPSYGGYSSRSRSRSRSYSRSSRSYSSYSSRSRSRSFSPPPRRRSRSPPPRRRSRSRDDIRDSRSRSRSPMRD